MIAYSPGFFPAEFRGKPMSDSDAGLGRCMASNPKPAKRRHPTRPTPKPRAVRPSMEKLPVTPKDVSLAPMKGGPGRGGGQGGQAWRIDVDGRRAGIVFINFIDELPIGPHASVQIYLNAPSSGAEDRPDSLSHGVRGEHVRTSSTHTCASPTSPPGERRKRQDLSTLRRRVHSEGDGLAPRLQLGNPLYHLPEWLKPRLASMWRWCWRASAPPFEPSCEEKLRLRQCDAGLEVLASRVDRH